MCHLGGFVIADLGSQRGHQHQGILDIEINLGAIDLDSFDHELHESVTGVADQRHRMQEVVNNDWLKNIQLEVALRSRITHGGSRAVHLRADHGHGFALRGIHLARHDG